MAFRKKILIAILENEQKEQKIGNGLITFKIHREQKIENPGITFKFLHVIVVKQSNLKKGKQKKHHEICFRRP